MNTCVVVLEREVYVSSTDTFRQFLVQYCSQLSYQTVVRSKCWLLFVKYHVFVFVVLIDVPTYHTDKPSYVRGYYSLRVLVSIYVRGWGMWAHAR